MSSDATPGPDRTPEQQAAFDRFTHLVQAYEGDVRPAVREMSGLTLTGIGERLGVGRSDVSICFSRTAVSGESAPRAYPDIRRGVEPLLGLAPYDLDLLLDGDPRAADRT